MAALEGPPSLRWLLNPASTTDASPRHLFQAESPACLGLETRVEDDVPKRRPSIDFSGLSTDSRQPLRPRDDNSGFNEIQPASNGFIYPQPVPHSNKRRFHEIDDRDCQWSDISAELPDQPRPKFYRNKTAMRAPPKPMLQQCHYISVYGTPLQPKGRDIYGKDGSLQCPYTGCPRTFEIFTQYDEMKAHFAQHANQRAETEIRSRHSYHIELESVNGSCFSFAPKKYTADQGDTLPKPVAKKQPSSRHKTSPDAHTVRTKRRVPSSVAQETAKPSQRGVARTIYDVTHPSRAPLPKAKTSSSLTPETHRPGRTIYDVQHPTARRSQRLAGKKDGDAQCKSKVR
ncbi:hypothetical protein ARMSODRAFT_1009270 [Armillaria solidipes]|uniref:Uncharacterized protein n=1 Tax=Armillaria solidipes TaxID=1076256 RepID=A0A2H3B9R2_9AGAR|nr:hypothetical protein ARMSODRAFT_1009270 [Armillaria solidipes]